MNLFSPISDNLRFSACNIGMEITEAEQNRLIVSHMELVEPIAAQFRGRKGIPFEDLVASGREGLVRAARNNKNPGRAKFSTYAAEYIRGYVQNFVASWQHLVPVGDSEEIDRNFHEWDIWASAAPFETWTSLSATPEELLIAHDNLREKEEKVREAWKHLPKKERSIIWARYFREPQQTLNSISREYKIPYSTLVDLIARTLAKLAESVKENPPIFEGTAIAPLKLPCKPIPVTSALRKKYDFELVKGVIRGGIADGRLPN